MSFTSGITLRRGLVVLLVAALALRLWGLGHGLPWAYNADEAAHFVPRAIGHGWDPGYLANPPAYTHLLHLVFLVAPDGFATGRVVAAVLGAAGVGLLAYAGARLDRLATGLIAGAVLAVAFLPVFSAHLAVNDAPALAAVCLVLAAAGRMRAGDGSALDHALAGAAVGLAAATKYTAAVAVLAVIAASPAPRRLLVAAGAALGAFVVAAPNALLDADRFTRAVTRVSGYSGRHKLGLPEGSGHAFYLEVLTWGVGWAPAIAALAGALVLLRRDRRLAAILLVAPVAYLLFMGAHERHFARWALPAVPFVALLAGVAAARLPRRLVPLAAVLLVAQGLVTSVLSDVALSREDTRSEARRRMLAGRVPAGTRIVVEPFAPSAWARPWRRRPLTTRAEGYQRTLRPALLGAYRREGFCTVVTGSTQEGRALREPGRALRALAYYRALRRRSTVLLRVAPWRGRPVRFDFDTSYLFRPPGYVRPGEEVTVRRLRGCPEAR